MKALNLSKLQKLLSLGFAAAIQVSALAGTGSTGGGNSTADGDLFDFSEVIPGEEGKMKLDQEVGFTEGAKSTLKNLSAAGLRSLAVKLEMNLREKPIYFVESEINPEACLNNQGIVLIGEIKAIACQDKDKIVIQKSWWILNNDRVKEGLAKNDTALRNRGIKNLGGLLVHESLVSLALRKGWNKEKTATFEPTLREINRMIHSGEIDVLKLQSMLGREYLGNFVTIDEANKARAILLKKLKPENCTKLGTEGALDVTGFIFYEVYDQFKNSFLGLYFHDSYKAAMKFNEGEVKTAKTVCNKYKDYLNEKIYETYYH